MLKRYYIINFATHQQSTHIPMHSPITCGFSARINLKKLEKLDLLRAGKAGCYFIFAAKAGAALPFGGLKFHFPFPKSFAQFT